MEDQIEMAPVVKPTSKEFANFEEYIQAIENKYAKNYGMVKVVPPRGWKARKDGYEEVIQHGMIPQPIEQNAYGKGGIYECLHIVQKSLSMKEYRKRNLPFNNVTDGKSIEECERMFYKNIAFSPPLYGADSRNTLFDEGIPWNLSSLKNMLNDGIDGVISGVNDPYLYVGSWKTLFSWHKEDLDLGAINYVHHGKPKFWYAIPEEDAHYLEKMAKLYFADSFNKCSEYMRHKTTVISPYLLKKRFPKCRVHKMQQKEREFIVVFPGAYHHGFNYGFNIAEAVNYATKNWLPIFMKAKICRCISDLVKINHQQFYENLVSKKPSLASDPAMKQFLKAMKEQGLYEQLNNNNINNVKALPIQKKKIQKIGRNATAVINSQDEDSDASDSSTTVTVPRSARGVKKSQKSSQKQQKQQKQQQKQQQQKLSSEQRLQARNSRKDQQNKKQNEPQMIMEDWLQCDSCRKWRKIDDTLKGLKRKKNFYCQNLSVKCSQPEIENIYTLSIQQSQQQQV